MRRCIFDKYSIRWFEMITFSPSLNGARPLYGHVAQRKASPSPHCNIHHITKNMAEKRVIFSKICHPATLKLNKSTSITFPHADWGLFSCSAVSPSFCTFSSASARPQVQFLQAFLVVPTSQSPTALRYLQYLYWYNKKLAYIEDHKHWSFRSDQLVTVVSSSLPRSKGYLHQSDPYHHYPES